MARTGRPKIEFDDKDLDMVETFGQIKASYEVMASHFGCVKNTIARHMEDESSQFCVRYKKGLGNTKQSLAMKQIEVALKGNTTMLIWLGKQLLGQVDEQKHDVSGKVEFGELDLSMIRAKLIGIAKKQLEADSDSRSDSDR
jgi:hypothetical protein